MQEFFNPVRFGFRWVGDWYEFDRPMAIREARKARDEWAGKLKAEGRQVRKFTLANQLTSMGGVGSGHPQIEVVVPIYGLSIL